MSKIITFTNILGLDFFPPKPAVKEVPDWYRDTPEYRDNLGKKYIDNGTTHTIKKCMPVFDAITAGYILYTQVDIQVTQVNNTPYYSWPSQDAISHHSLSQAPLHPAKQNGIGYAKFNNPYGITTPPGYSTLFTQPFHRESVFTIFPGIVDTDTYKNPVTFPFVLNDVKWEGIILAGTPMVQVTPFKRESWEHKIGSNEERQEQEKNSKKLNTMLFNSYKKQFWFKKEYK